MQPLVLAAAVVLGNRGNKNNARFHALHLLHSAHKHCNIPQAIHG